MHKGKTNFVHLLPYFTLSSGGDFSIFDLMRQDSLPAESTTQIVFASLWELRRKSSNPSVGIIVGSRGTCGSTGAPNCLLFSINLISFVLFNTPCLLILNPSNYSFTRILTGYWEYKNKLQIRSVYLIYLQNQAHK